MEDAYRSFPPYRSFLQSSDLATWQASLDHYRDLMAAGGMPLPRLIEAICIAQYTLWLASLCGEEEIEDAAVQSRDAFAALAAGHDLHASKDGLRARSLIAAARGYGATATAMLAGAGHDVPLEIAVIMMPSPPTRRAQLLRDRLGPEPGTTGFLPAVYFYAHALLDLGYFDHVRGFLLGASSRKDVALPAESNRTRSNLYIDQLRRVLDQADPERETALFVDLRGKLAELSGDWAAAHRLYRASDWSTHRYRASICATILDPAIRLVGGRDWQEADAKLLRGMQFGSAETDQTEVLRTAALVHACRWHHFDSWLVQYELGFLSFRRRRHAEAEEHLAAARAAPEPARFAIDSLRFTNLTWYGDPAIDTRPETLECAYATLDAAAPERDKAYVRTWLARETRDLSLLDPIDAGCTAFARGEAMEIRGRIPEALECWAEAVAAEHVPRALHRLIATFAEGGFHRTTDYLIGIARDEAEDSFFDLWELGDTLHRVREGADSGLAARIDVERSIEQIAARLEQLAEFEFQHLIRAHGLYLRLNRGDLADRALKRAGRLAESAEEHLALARASPDELGHRHLLAAAREASHRGMRIDIARCFAEIGQIATARQILRAAQVFDPAARLEPLEYVSALKCPDPCLTEDERADLLARATRHLEENLQAGRHPRCGGLFLERLDRLGAAISPELQGRFARADGDRDDAETLWSSWAKTLERLDEPALLAEERRSMEARAAGYDDAGAALFHQLTVWHNLRRMIDSLRQAIKGTRPEREPDQTPIRRAATEHARPDRIGRLWRQQLTAGDPARAEALLEQVRTFYREEAALEAGWETQRRSEMQRDLRRAQSYVDWAGDVLDRLARSVRRGGIWPPFLAIETHMLEDIAELRAGLARALSIEGLGDGEDP